MNVIVRAHRSERENTHSHAQPDTNNGMNAMVLLGSIYESQMHQLTNGSFVLSGHSVGIRIAAGVIVCMLSIGINTISSTIQFLNQVHVCTRKLISFNNTTTTIDRLYDVGMCWCA